MLALFCSLFFFSLSLLISLCPHHRPTNISLSLSLCLCVCVFIFVCLFCVCVYFCVFLTVDGYTHRLSRASVGACGSGGRRFTTGRCREASPRSSARKPQTATDPQPKLAGLAAGWRAVRRNLGFDEGECQASCQRTGVHTNRRTHEQ